LLVISRLALRVLAWVIVAYRRVLSGRGPMRCVRCSFAPDESCSAYGLRAVRESTTAREAIAKILRRLRRCRDACLVGDGRALSWTPLHDRSPSEIADDMHRDAERPDAIARMLATRRIVALWRRDRAALRDLASSCVHRRPHRPTVCSTHAIERRARRRIVVRIAAGIAIAVGLHTHPALDVAIMVLVVAATVLAVRALAAHRRRFTQHATSFARPL
jgi:putative component of membrane protein insertase Oxa1/YidC/SpoIIIJ protein YidD